MSTNHTPNYSLSQWEADDKVLREDFNRDNQIIDEVLAGKGNCSVYISLYTGTGKYGSNFSTNTKISLPRNPTAAIVIGGGALLVAHLGRAETNQIFSSTSGISVSGSCEASWGTVPALYLESSTSAAHQMNSQGILYSVIAFYCES